MCSLWDALLKGQSLWYHVHANKVQYYNINNNWLKYTCSIIYYTSTRYYIIGDEESEECLFY